MTSTTTSPANRAALVTGASRGIGAAIAQALSRTGFHVAVNYHSNHAAASAVVSEIQAQGGKALAVQADVRDPAAVKAMVDTVRDELGLIDTLVLNAGMPVPAKPFLELSYEEFQEKTSGELAAFFHTVREVEPHMALRGSGCIIGISSTLSRNPSQGFSAHTTAKSGVDGLMKSLALELGPQGIRVNTVAPGLTVTDATQFMPSSAVEAIAGMTPLQRIAQPSDIASAVACVASDSMGFVSGAYIPVAGGLLMP